MAEWFPNLRRSASEALEYPRGLEMPKDIPGQIYYIPGKAAGVLGAGLSAIGDGAQDLWNHLTGREESAVLHRPIPPGPFGRTRRMISEALGPLFSREIFKHPLGTLGNAAIRLVSGLDKVLLDGAELFVGEGNRSTARLRATARNQTHALLKAA